jgi:hypothetical protein
MQFIHSFLFLFSLIFLPTLYLPAFYSFIHSFIHPSIVLQPFVGPWPFRRFPNLFNTVGRTPWWVISPSQGRYLHTGQHKYKINAHTNIHASSGFRIHNPSIRVGEGSSCLRPRGHCDRLSGLSLLQIVIYFVRCPSFLFPVFNPFIDPKLFCSFSMLL